MKRASRKHRRKAALIGLFVAMAVAVTAAVVVVEVRSVRNRVRDPITRAVVAIVVSPWQRHVLWEHLRPMPRPKTDPASALVGGLLYVFGGMAHPDDLGIPQDRSVLVYDPAVDRWSRRNDAPADLGHVSATVDGSSVWFAGGFVGREPGAATDVVLRYDTATDTWTRGPSLPHPVAAGTLVRVGRTLHYAGGLLADRDSTTGEHWALDLDANGGWQARAPLAVPRAHLSGAALGGRFYAIGGQLRHDTDPADLDVVEVYDPATDHWSPAASLPCTRSHTEAGTFVHGRRIYVVGGRNNRRLPILKRAGIANVTVYDPAVDTWTELAVLPLGLEGPVARAVGDRLIVSGGVPMGGVYAQLETFAVDLTNLQAH